VSAFDSQLSDSRRIELLGLLRQVNDQYKIADALTLMETTESHEIAMAALRLAARSDELSTWLRLTKQLHQPRFPTTVPAIVEILLSRTASARLLLDQIESGKLTPESLSTEQVRRVSLLENSQLNAIVSRYWGKMQASSPGEVLAEIRRLSNDLRAASGEVGAGKAVFTKHCANCHQLFGEGTKLGPDLTASNRQDREFLLTSLVDPSNSIRAEYVSWVVQTVDGRVLTGLPESRDDDGLTLVDSNSRRQQIATSDIEDMREASQSLMPQDLYKQLSPQELRDLFAYLQDDAR